MSAPKKDDQVTVDPITTAVGCLGSKGLIAVGTRLKELPIEQFSDNWMKLVTKTDQNKLRSYRTQQALLKKADEGPTIDDALEANQELRDALKSTNGKLGALQQKLEAMQAQIDELQKSTPKSDVAPQKTAPPKPAGDGGAEKPKE